MILRFGRVGVVVLVGLLVTSCASVGPFIGDNLPAWAGGLPPDAPPRRGAPGYDDYMKSIGSEQAASDASVKPAEPPPAPAPPRKPAKPVDAPTH